MDQKKKKEIMKIIKEYRQEIASLEGEQLEVIKEYKDALDKAELNKLKN